MMDTYHYSFVKIHRKYTPENEDYCKQWGWGTYINVGLCNKCTTHFPASWDSMLIVVEAMECWNRKCMGTLCYLLTFAMNPELL